MASEGDASLIVQTHADRLKEEQKRENEKKREMELAKKPSEFSSGVKIGFAGLANAPMHTFKASICIFVDGVSEGRL